MTNEEILQKSLKKAVANEFDYIAWWMKEAPNVARYIPADKELMLRDEHGFQWVLDHPKTLVFDHNFAKAFWGTEKANKFGLNPELEVWQLRLCEMVLEEDPIKYLEQSLKEDKKEDQTR